MMLAVKMGSYTEESVQATLDIATAENTSFFLSRMEDGIAVPRNTFNAGVQYCPDQPSQVMAFEAADVLLETRIGSCGSIAAYEAGMLRARAIRRGMPPRTARKLYRAVVILQHEGRRNVWHAVVETPQGQWDPSAGLRQVCANPRV